MWAEFDCGQVNIIKMNLKILILTIEKELRIVEFTMFKKRVIHLFSFGLLPQINHYNHALFY